MTPSDGREALTGASPVHPDTPHTQDGTEALSATKGPDMTDQTTELRARLNALIPTHQDALTEIDRLNAELAEAREGGAKLLAVAEQFQAQRDQATHRALASLSDWCTERAADLATHGRPTAGSHAMWDVVEEIRRRKDARTAASYRPCASQVIPGVSRDDGGYCIANATDGFHCKAHAEALREATSDAPSEPASDLERRPHAPSELALPAATEDQQ